VTGLGVRLELSPALLVAGRPVRWTFAVQNRGTKRRTLAFTSSQQGDVVLEAGGVEAYRWSRGMMFATVISEREIVPGAEWTFALGGALSVEPGAYSLVASVSARPAPPPVRGEISIRAD
jgi:hypothetical protein